MGCNCGQKGSSTSYTFTAPDGTVKQNLTEIQAKAAKIKAGGGTYQAVPK